MQRYRNPRPENERAEKVRTQSGPPRSPVLQTIIAFTVLYSAFGIAGGAVYNLNSYGLGHLENGTASCNYVVYRLFTFFWVFSLDEISGIHYY